MLSQGDWEETDAHSCLKECNCPADGSACHFTGACKTDSFACKAGYQRFSNGEAKCYPVGCEEGSLQVLTAPAALSTMHHNETIWGRRNTSTYFSHVVVLNSALLRS